jgi:hypothetical protein
LPAGPCWCRACGGGGGGGAMSRTSSM